jgi:hypothetical protein
LSVALPTPGVSPTTRRALLATLSALPLAGCTIESEGPPEGVVHVFNQTNFPQTVHVRVTTADGEPRLDERFEVPAGERTSSEAVLDAPGEYDVTATTDEYETSRTLTLPPADGGTGDGEGSGEEDSVGNDGPAARGYVRVAISRDGLLVSRAGLT